MLTQSLPLFEHTHLMIFFEHISLTPARSYNQILAPDGDTAVYLQYSHARMCSIIRKVKAASYNPIQFISIQFNYG